MCQLRPVPGIFDAQCPFQVLFKYTRPNGEIMNFHGANAGVHQHRISHLTLFIQQRIIPEISNFTLMVTPQLGMARDDQKIVQKQDARGRLHKTSQQPAQSGRA
jgi:hypothetical protein